MHLHIELSSRLTMDREIAIMRFFSMTSAGTSDILARFVVVGTWGYPLTFYPSIERVVFISVYITALALAEWNYTGLRTFQNSTGLILFLEVKELRMTPFTLFDDYTSSLSLFEYLASPLADSSVDRMDSISVSLIPVY